MTAVGLNSETGTIMTLLGATDDSEADETEKKENKETKKKQSNFSILQILPHNLKIYL